MIEYKYYEPNKGFEESQAQIYNEANPMNFPPATADQISQRYQEEAINPKTVRYAFEDEKMIAYIQARVRHPTKDIHLSFPWAHQGCPPEVQDTLFDDMLKYIQETHLNYQIRVNLPAKPDENRKFLQRKGFIEKNRWYQYFVELEAVSSLSYDQTRYSSRVATENDVESLIELIKTDGRHKSNLKTDSDIKEYLTGKVLAAGHFVSIFDNNKLVAAGAPLLYKLPLREKKVLILRFTAYRDSKTQEGFRPLLIEVARECIKTKYGVNRPLSLYSDQMDTPPNVRAVIEELNPEGEVAFYYFYQDKNE